MPAGGKDPTPPESVTFEDYVRALADRIQPLPEPVILVGHSRTSIISQVAERIPSRIRALVYVSGVLLPNGSTMLDTVNGLDPEYLSQIIWAPDGKTARLSAEGAAKFFFPLCPASIRAEVIPLLGPEAVDPFQERLQITDANFGRVPRYYVECVHDRILPVALQRKMHSAMPCKRVYSLNADHAPFFSAPSELCSALLSIAEQESLVAAAGLAC
jgi:pimeloyl-ACP methyl ester carboxylesterase